MGEVWRAKDTKLNRTVAIKFLSADVADVTARRRCQREAQAVSSLNHPHILTVYDVGDFEGFQYLITEFVDGGTLSPCAGITHRDIKPANILVTKSGYAKLADFGLAKLTETAAPEDETRTLTQEPTRPGVVVGTVAYMSPEQASGRRVDARSDIFSFGIVLYELLAGQRPFGGATMKEPPTPGLSPWEQTAGAVRHWVGWPLAATRKHKLRQVDSPVGVLTGQDQGTSVVVKLARCWNRPETGSLSRRKQTRDRC